MNLQNMSIEELAALRDDVISLLAEKIAARQRELESEIARITGLNGPLEKPSPRAKAKYRGPEGQEWSGRGAKPKWVEEELEKGRPLEALMAA